MAVTYVIDESARLVHKTATGPTSMADMVAANERLRADPAFLPTFNLLFDFRHATPTDLHSRQVETLLDTSPFSRSSLRAYVVAPGVGYGLGRVAEAIGEYQHRLVRIFLDVESAREWLRAGLPREA